MAYRQQLPTESVLRIDGFYSIYDLTLSNGISNGELHDFYEVVYVESGFYYVILDGKRHVVPPGSCVFFSPNTYHSGDGSTPVNAKVRIISFESKSAGMWRFDNRVYALSEEETALFFCAFQAAEKCMTYKNKHVLCLKPNCGAVDLQFAQLQFESFLLALYKQGAPSVQDSSRIRARKEEFFRISDYLKANLHRSLTLEIIADECSLSISKLKTLCRSFADCSPIEYLISLRIIRSKYLILEGKLTFGEIAEVTGFGSPHYFSRVFRDRTGMTPTQYANDPNQEIFF